MKRVRTRDNRVNIFRADCLELMRKIKSNSIDSIVTDPPYFYKFMGKDWDSQLPGIKYWKEMLRVAKPGAILLSFGGPRTFHRLTCNIEDAGWEIRDCICWIYGSGFPKSLNIERAATDSTWNGWGTALKPAYEPITVAMKPLDGTFAQNALKWGVAGLNIDGCRIPTKDNLNGGGYSTGESKGMWTPGKDGGGFRRLPGEFVQPPGRWPANLVLDSEAAKLVDQQAGVKKSGARKADTIKKSGSVNCYGKDNRTGKQVYPEDVPASEGGPSRFFYTAKPSRRERGEFNDHPTVKSLELMKYLCLLTKTPTGGVVLDPFMGSGTTGLACLAPGRKFVGIEKEKAYFKIARRRIQEKIKG